MCAGPRKIARNPASSSSDSQPKPYQTWPTLTIEEYSSHSSVHSATHAHTGARSATWASRLAATPVQAAPASQRSEQRRWNRLGARPNGTRSTNRATGVSPRSPSKPRNWRRKQAKPIR